MTCDINFACQKTDTRRGLYRKKGKYKKPRTERERRSQSPSVGDEAPTEGPPCCSEVAKDWGSQKKEKKGRT